MHIILEGNALLPRRAGIGRYTMELVKELERHERVSSVRILMHYQYLLTVKEALDFCASSYPGPPPPSWAARITAGLARRAQAIRPLKRPIEELIGDSDPTKYQHLISEQFFWLRIKLGRASVFHAPNFIAEKFVGSPVLTVHDLSIVRFPETHPADRIRRIRKGLDISLSLAPQIIAVSEFTKRELQACLDVPPDRISVVKLGVSERFHPRPEGELKPDVERYGLRPKQFCLCVGSIEPRKNLAGLLRAWENLPFDLRRETPLVIVGAKGWKNSAINSLLEDAERQGTVKLLGFVDDDDLPSLLAAAKIFVYPSIYEGFGLPIIEAMASGVPVLCSNTASMPEVADDAAMLVDPNSVESITRGLQVLLEDADLRNDFASRGLERSQQFSWQRCADETVAVYEKAARSGNRTGLRETMRHALSRLVTRKTP